MKYIQSEKNYFYKLYKNGKKKRISFETYQKGGFGRSEKELIKELRDAGKYDEWVKSHLYGITMKGNSNRRFYEYTVMDGSTRKFSLISSSYSDGEINTPVFNFIKSTAPPNASASASASMFRPKKPVVRRNMSVMANNIISLEILEDRFRRLIENESESLLILIGETHNINTEINLYIQSQILEIINSLTKVIVPVYSEMPKEIVNSISKSNNKNNRKLLNTEKSSFLRLYYYLKYLQVPKGKNIIISSEISKKNRVNRSCNPEYSEDIKKLCEKNNITIGILGALHIKCIKEILDNSTLTNGKKLKVITIVSNTSENMLGLVNKCSGKLSKNNSANAHNIGCDVLLDSILLDIPNVSELGEKLFRKIMAVVFA
jgi:hypothetical protein